MPSREEIFEQIYTKVKSKHFVLGEVSQRRELSVSHTERESHRGALSDTLGDRMQEVYEGK